MEQVHLRMISYFAMGLSVGGLADEWIARLLGRARSRIFEVILSIKPVDGEGCAAESLPLGRQPATETVAFRAPRHSFGVNDDKNEASEWH